MNLNDKEFVLCSKHCHLESEKLRKGKKQVKDFFETGWHISNLLIVENEIIYF